MPIAKVQDFVKDIIPPICLVGIRITEQCRLRLGALNSHLLSPLEAVDPLKTDWKRHGLAL
jgi:hypothetical protein